MKTKPFLKTNFTFLGYNFKEAYVLPPTITPTSEQIDILYKLNSQLKKKYMDDDYQYAALDNYLTKIVYKYIF